MANTNSYSTAEAADEVRQQELSSAEELLGDPEPWEPWETKLVSYSIGIALVGLVILGYLINTFILN